MNSATGSRKEQKSTVLANVHQHNHNINQQGAEKLSERYFGEGLIYERRLCWFKV